MKRTSRSLLALTALALSASPLACSSAGEPSSSSETDESLSAAATGGSLSGSAGTTAPGTNLTALGTSDWAHWGRGESYAAVDRKASGGSQIGALGQTGSGGNYGPYASSAYGVSWSDGTPQTSGSDDGYLWSNGSLGSGFTFSAPADTRARTLSVYFGASTASVTLSAKLSDGSASAYSVSETGPGAWLATIHYQAASANQSLQITLLKTGNNAGTTDGSADLIAAALSGGTTTPPPPPPGGHEFDDGDPSIVYSLGQAPQDSHGGASEGIDGLNVWGKGGDSGDYRGTEHFANKWFSSFTVNFTGPDFQWIGRKGPNFGIATVSVDGHEVATVDNYSPSALENQVVYSVSGLANRAHAVFVTVGGYPNPAKNPASSDTYQVMDGYVTSGASLNLASVAAWGSGVTRSGSWDCGSGNPGDLSGGHCWSNEPGASLSLAFSGTGFEVYTRPDGENGYTDVYVDGNFVLSSNSFSLPYDTSCDDCINAQDSITVDGLTAGAHTVKLVVSTNKDPAASDRYTQVDELKILP